MRSSLQSLHDVIKVAPFNRNVHHRGFCPKQLPAVWSLPLQSGSEGPTFIFRTARRFRAFLTQPPTPPDVRFSASGGWTQPPQVAARSDGKRKPYRRRTELLRAWCNSGWAATRQAPRRLVATPRAMPVSPNRRRLRSRPWRPCHRHQKHFRMCPRTHFSSSRMGFRASASRK